MVRSFDRLEHSLISVIIPTYQSPQALDLCLRSAIQGQKNINQIIVVVDGFYKINEEVLKKWKNFINILNLETNQGLCRGTNLGVYNAESDKILIVNDDNVFPEKWDEKLEEVYDPTWVVAPNQIEPYPSMFHQFIIKDMGTDPNTFSLEDYWSFCNNLEYNTKIDNTGSTLPIFMNKEKFLAVGGWDENYQKGMVADWDFFLKCSLIGLTMKRLYTCPFYHFVSISVNNEKRQLAETQAHSYARYKWGTYIKHNPISNLKYI
jgi:glycosyltransferase involved in cell wall biosynthesis